MGHTTFYFKCYISRKTHLILRLTELVCCTICFALAVVVFNARLYFVTKIMLMVVSTTFLFVTLIDAISWIHLRPIGYRTWILFSVAAYHMFFLSGGFLVYLKRDTKKTLLQVTCGFNFFTGLAYILDCAIIILQYCLWVNKKKSRVAPQVDRAVSTCTLHPENEYYFGRYSYTGRLRTFKCRPATCSYGGTFAVSKELPPLPTPDPLRDVDTRKRMYSTLVSPRRNLTGSARARAAK